MFPFPLRTLALKQSRQLPHYSCLATESSGMIKSTAYLNDTAGLKLKFQLSPSGQAGHYQFRYGQPGELIGWVGKNFKE
ncbi:hypothetical protein PoB_000446000 [Plakobranchus ocellatus]|uniref:Uncharacterized protein n=1 Tax=Plakobranchus ocellatus TaxID=259542 RepID=A0AAV3Y575_9GAST|nr:hypothetical protein PoB_000446000 [Plakobranchus ocellatus]